MTSTAFHLDPRLSADSFHLGEMPLSSLYLKDDARFAWIVMVPRRADMRELIDLNEADSAQLMSEIRAVSQALQAEVAHDKLNVAAIGNIVSQLHVHIVARSVDDAAWPAPVWGVGTAEAYAGEAGQHLATRLKARLGLTE
jgi:diadenosine tetraphosphate (Ap4A) HIT family hydrolase